MQSNQIKKWPSELIKAFERAVKLAKEVDEMKSKQKYCLAAVGLRNDGTMVYAQNGGGCCAIKNRHPFQSHAEARLTKKLDVDSIVFVARVKKKNYESGNAKPCANCEGFMRAKGISRVYYTTDDSWSFIEFKK